MDPGKEFDRLVKEHGGKLIRQRKHRVYKFPSGVVFVCASTPSDRRADDNILCHLKRVLKSVVVKSPMEGSK